MFDEDFGYYYTKFWATQRPSVSNTDRNKAYDDFCFYGLKKRISKKVIKDFLLAGFMPGYDSDISVGYDSDVSVSYDTCRIIYNAIKDYDNDQHYGYMSRPNLEDIKALFKESWNTHSSMIWHQKHGIIILPKAKQAF